MTPSRLKLGLAVLLITGASGAFARAGGQDVRDAVRDAHQYGRVEQGNGARQHGGPQQGRDHASPGDDSSRRGKMSPEDRRALRQQINEAGQDIYNPRRR